MEMIIPVGVFDDHFHLRVDSLCRIHHQFTSSLRHEFEPVFRPTLITLRRYLIIIFQVDEEEVIQNEIVEKPGGKYSDTLYLLPFLLARVTVSFEIGWFGSCEGDSSPHLQTF